jgi:hypothetical protein
VSYFLRGYLDTCQISTADPLYRGLCTVSIKNGAIVDPMGNVAKALMSAMQVTCPLESLCLHALDHSLPPRLLLAGFNASLVSISFDGRSGQCSWCSHATVRLQEPNTAGGSDGHIGSSDHHCFELDFVLNDSSPIPCDGLGIVADVDLGNHCVHIVCADLSGWELWENEVWSSWGSLLLL